MVIMDNFYQQDRLSELWNKIDQFHLTFLDIEESPEKIEIRNKLEDLIREYLCIASHKQKFSLSVTYEVLLRSAQALSDFSGYKAATGFNAIQLYAGNLLSQPWRKEYKQIRKYSGFYKHHVEANLVNGELLLEAMGYKPVALSTLILDGPIGPDRVITVSKDCLIAYVECQIMKAIWEEMTGSNINISWMEILEFRQTHLCSPEQSIKALKYAYQQKQFQDHIRNGPQGNMNLYNVPLNYSNNSLSPLTNHEPPPMVPPHYLYGVNVNGCCQNPCMSYAQVTCPQHTAISYPSQMIKPQFSSSGYYYANGPMNQHAIYNHNTVPIAQLIEVEPQNNYDVVDRPGHSRSTQRLYNMGDMYANYNGVDLMGRDNRDSDKTDSQFEDWDYVYKKLETQGYNKDLGERGDVLSLGLDGRTKMDSKSSDKKKKEKEPKKSKLSSFEISMNNLTLSNKSKQNTLDKTSKQRKTSDSKSQVDVSPASSYDNLSPNDKKQSAKISKLSVSKSKLDNADKSVSTKQTPKPLKKEEKPKTESSDWHCKTCTFLNKSTRNICKMCSKSRCNVEEEIEVGGPECENCTLVNTREAKVCQACGESLENSPTRV
ncbi:protein tamozhennic [Coccinella septempunctata]|uniref:protein tamozhennic n=1 Tax=Coccinella septempunctata TaxID=41139 RepID=UPI001D07F999|nr:protein tamozhennic [Coccinella septempunctata]XP_044746003.1 protein tamozhennic [Coccinella septempunctata]